MSSGQALQNHKQTRCGANKWLLDTTTHMWPHNLQPRHNNWRANGSNDKEQKYKKE